jgi:hypothetical protein
VQCNTVEDDAEKAADLLRVEIGAQDRRPGRVAPSPMPGLRELPEPDA